MTTMKTLRIGRNLLAATRVIDPVTSGNAERDRQNWIAAAGHYKRALKLAPKNQPIWVQYGHALKESGQLSAAEDAYRRAVQLQPQDSDAHLQLGHCLKVRGNLTSAMGSYLESVRLDPQNRNARFELEHFGWTSGELEHLCQGANTRWAAQPSPEFNPVIVPFIQNYAETFADVAALVSMGLVASAEQHFDLYGHVQGRDVLATFAETKPTTAFVLCPSFFKRCGIGEHSRYLAQSIETSGFTVYPVRSTADLAQFSDEQLRDAVLIVNHGPGLFDGYNPELSEGEATVDLLATLRRYFISHNLRPLLFMHSLLDRDNTVMFPRQQMALEFPIPVVTTIEAAARTFNIPRVEHGMQPIGLPAPPTKATNARDLPTIGFFGFFQWGGKNFDALFEGAQKIKAKLVGSVATGSNNQVGMLKKLIEEKGIQCDIGTGWVEDFELAARLNEADYYYLPQHDYDHWNNSGTARFVMNFGRPVIVPPHKPFLDLRSFVVFANDEDLPQVMAHLRSSSHYERASDRVKEYGKLHAMPQEMARLASEPHTIAVASGIENFLDVNETCAVKLLQLDLPQLQARVRHISPGLAGELESAASTPERMAEIRRLQQLDPGNYASDRMIVLPLQYWRKHYDISDLIFQDRLDGFYAAFRALLKREPDLHDLARFGGRYWPAERRSDSSFIEDALRLISHLKAVGHTLEFAAQVQLYHQGKLLTTDALLQPSLAAELAARYEKTARLLALPVPRDEVDDYTSTFYNIVQILPTHPDLLQGLLQSAAQNANVSADFSRVSRIRHPFQRFVAISDCLATVGAKLTDVFVIDQANVRPISISRNKYSLAEFWLLDGDDFLFDAVGCLLKRAPLAAELYQLEDLLQNSGRMGVLKYLLAHSACQARIVDLSEYNEDRLRSDAISCTTVGRELRSVYAGGWDQRNAYLEACRNTRRFWLNIKGQRNRFYSQSGQREEIIKAVVENIRGTLS